MGALDFPITHWNTEDDVKLKNSIEAGASLESLAKGAVRFSQRYTFEQLRDRWHSLLYDPFVSEEAANRMFQFEHAASLLSHPSKSNSNRYGNGNANEKDKENPVSKKRKAENVRKCYYAIRRRIFKQHFNSMDLSGLVAKDDHKPPTQNCMLGGDPIANHIRNQQPNFDPIHHSFPHVGMDVNSVPHAYHVGDNNFPAERNNVLEDTSHTLGQNQRLAGNFTTVGIRHQSKEFPVCNMFEAANVEEKGSSSFDRANNDSRNISSPIFSSPISDCGVSFQNFGSSLQFPEMPIWNTVEDPHVPIDINNGENQYSKRDDVALPDYGGEAESTKGFLEELSNSLLNFTNEEELNSKDIDGKNTIGKSYYDRFSSLLSISPSDNVEFNENVDGHIAVSEIQSLLSVFPSEKVESNDNVDERFTVSEIRPLSSISPRDKVESNDSVGGRITFSELPLPLVTNSRYVELREGVICCTLNTEDEEIPNNDDIISIIKQKAASLSTFAQKKCHEAKNRSSLFGGENVLENTKHNEKKNCGLPDIDMIDPFSGRGLEVEFSKEDTEKIEEDSGIDAELNKYLFDSVDSIQEETANVSDGFKSHLWTNGSYSTQEMGVCLPTITNETLQAPHKEPRFSMDAAMEENVAKPSISGQEELHFEDDYKDYDDCVPEFSDIEAMILNMELCSDDQDIHFREELLKYDEDDAKRKIVRVEQSFHSCMQREIASNQALAVFYGRKSKHYIKKPEVLLGRSTQDITVDIDLGRERCGTKISRRQAIMKMDGVGNFYMKNLGKLPILVNDKEIAYGESRALDSGCLIQIREMPFIFETNQACVKQYMDNEEKH